MNPITTADLVAVRMARILADAGYEVHLDLWREEWTVQAIKAERTTRFVFRCSAANMLTDPEGYAQLHARTMRAMLETDA